MDNNKENTRRLEIFYKESHSWLLAASYNITKNKEAAEDLVGELYCYLGERINPKLWWGQNSFNVMYAYSFIKSRFLNKVKRDKKVKYQENLPSDSYSVPDDEYDIEYDADLERAYNDVVEELKAMEYTRNWAPSKLTQLYYYNPEMTLDKLAKEIKISKSTAFLNIRKTRTHLKNVIDNPFTHQD